MLGRGGTHVRGPKEVKREREGHASHLLNLWADCLTLNTHSCTYLTQRLCLATTYQPLVYITSTTTMSEAAKPDPAADQAANPGPTLVKDETAKVTTDKAADKAEATTESTDNKPLTEKATEAAGAVKDNVFSMFGGGPAKAKKEEADDVDEPSGSSKNKGDVGISVQVVWKLC